MYLIAIGKADSSLDPGILNKARVSTHKSCLSLSNRITKLHLDIFLLYNAVCT